MHQMPMISCDSITNTSKPQFKSHLLSHEIPYNPYFNTSKNCQIFALYSKMSHSKILKITIPSLELKRNLIPYLKTRPKCAQNFSIHKG